MYTVPAGPTEQQPGAEDPVPAIEDQPMEDTIQAPAGLSTLQVKPPLTATFSEELIERVD